MAKANVSLGVARAWHSTGTFDAAAVGSLAAWRSAGFATTDVYMFPCSFRSAVDQVTELLGNLTSHGAQWHRIWLGASVRCGVG